MSKIVIVCDRANNIIHMPNNKIRAFFERITPDNIEPNPPRLERHNGILVGVFNPTGAYRIDEKSAYLGMLFSPRQDWAEVGKDIPDGSFALFRYNKDWIEVVADSAALMTIWYAHTPEIFVATTSQRIAIYFLKSFVPNYQAFPWVLSTGYLGPENSWDRRIKRIQPAERLTLNRKSWKIKNSREMFSFEIEHRSDNEHMEALKDDLISFIDSIDIDVSRWILPLSGGYDSRLLFLRLKDRKDFNCVTWGLEKSLSNTENDAYIASKLAEYYNIKHDYYITDLNLCSKNTIEKVFNRFLTASEGRVDHVTGYTDGMKIWKILFDSKRIGVIRGTEAFGWGPVTTRFDVIRRIDLRMLKDYPNLKPIAKHLNSMWGKQVLPEVLDQKKGETLSMWRDRLFIEYCCPVEFAGLTDNMLTYVDVIHPYMSRKILNSISKLPDHLRTGKTVFKKVVESMTPPLPFAKFPAIGDLEHTFYIKQVVELITDELDTSYAKSLLSKEFIDFILSGMTIKASHSTKKRVIKRRLQLILPPIIRNTLRNTVVKQKMNINLLAFRAYMICRMNKILAEDAQAALEVPN